MSGKTVETGVGGWQDIAKLPMVSERPNWIVAPRHTEIPSNVEVKGFTPERENFIRGLVERIGLPLDRVSEISYKPNEGKDEYTLGQAAIETGELFFFKRMESLPEHAREASQVAVASHELAHINTAFSPKNEKAYGGRENMADARKNVAAVASQTAETRSFLTGYHKFIYNQLQKGEISERIYLLETEAIMFELRISNPKKLEQVLKSQNAFSAGKIQDQLDKTLIKLMGFESKAELDGHVEALRDFYRPKEKSSE